MADLKQIKVGNTTYNIEPYTSYLPLAGGRMTGNLRMTENSTSILLRAGRETWYSGIYANTDGDEVLGIVAENPRTHIMLGTANPLDRLAATALTPAIDIKNGKVGINKRLGTDGSADAGSYELDVNGAIRANDSVDANSARISNGLYVGSSITHNSSGNLVIGNSANSNFVEFVEDVSASGWSISVDGEAEFDTIWEGGTALPDRYAPKKWISVNETTTGLAAAAANATGAVAIGQGTTSGEAGIAIGQSVAAASKSVAIGSSVGGTGGVCVGLRSTAYGPGIAIGYYSQVGTTGQTWSSANENIAIGKNAVAVGCSYAALAVGPSATATGQTTIALGYLAKAYTQPTTGSASGYGAIAIGGWASASGSKAIAIGPCAQAVSTNSIAIGFSISASKQNTIAMGTSVKATDPNSIAIGYTCCGTTSSVAIGNYCYASGAGSVAIGSASASGYYSVAIGDCTAGTTGCVAIGYNNYANTGTSTVAIGRDCYATGNYCISVGYKAKSAQTGSIAMGYSPTAGGVYSIAIGMYAKAYKDQSIVMGYYASATGTTSGYSSIVIGPSAVSYATNTGDSTYYSEMGNTVIGRKASVSGYGNVVVGVGDSTRHVSVSGFGNVVLATPTYLFRSATGNTTVRSNYGILVGSGSISGKAVYVRNGTGSYINYGTYLGGADNSSHTGASYLVLGTNTNYCYKTSAGASWTSASDIRDKTDIQSLTGGLEFISKITPITYVDNARTKYSEDGDITYNEDEHQKGTKKGTRRIAGVSAQETYSAQQEIYGTDNYGAVVDWSRHDHPDELEFDRYWVQYERFIPYLIDAVKTLNQKVCDLENEIKNLKSS